MLPETKNMQLATFGGVRHAGKHESAVLAITDYCACWLLSDATRARRRQTYT